jgi:hypothetical protein
MKTLMLIFVTANLLFSCEKIPHVPPNGDGPGGNPKKTYPADVAIKWINLQQKLIKSTAGFDPIVAGRSFAYSGVTLYESVLKGMPSGKSIVSPRIGLNINEVPHGQVIFWPASANAAMAEILKSIFSTTSTANKLTIDSLEAALNASFQAETTSEIINQSTEYGRTIAHHIFEWSKTDGGHEAYLKATDDTYVPPTGPGAWIPTPPAFSQPVRPYWGDNRSFVPEIATLTMPIAPPAYSESGDSEFYKMSNEVYTISQTLSDDDILIVKHWADLPGNYGTPAHYTNIATQLIEKNKLNLGQAAIAYAKHGIAINEALICVFKAKYIYNLIRPISYINAVLGHDSWTTVVGNPPHPEYPSAHAVIGGASYVILETIFGKNHSFVDRTHENLYGSHSYKNLKAYAEEASHSRVLGGIHYKFSAQVGLIQGEKVGNLVDKIFNGNYNSAL